MTKVEKENIALVRLLFDEVWNNRRTDLMQEIFSPDFVASYEDKEFQGLDNWKCGYYDTALKVIPDHNIEVMDILARGEIVVARWKTRGQFVSEIYDISPTGERVEFEGVSWITIKDGKIVKNWNRSDVSYFLRRLVAEVKTLKGLIPICSYCGKMKDDKGYWSSLEAYISKHTDAQLSHGICQECFERGAFKNE